MPLRCAWNPLKCPWNTCNVLKPIGTLWNAPETPKTPLRPPKTPLRWLEAPLRHSGAPCKYPCKPPGSPCEPCDSLNDLQTSRYSLRLLWNASEISWFPHETAMKRPWNILNRLKRPCYSLEFSMNSLRLLRPPETLLRPQKLHWYLLKYLWVPKKLVNRPWDLMFPPETPWDSRKRLYKLPLLSMFLFTCTILILNSSSSFHAWSSKIW